MRSLLVLIAALVQGWALPWASAAPTEPMQDAAPKELILWRKLWARMFIEYCSKHSLSKLTPCQFEVYKEGLRGLPAETRKAKTEEALRELEATKKKKLSHIIHDDSRIIYSEFCAPTKTYHDGPRVNPKATGEICSDEILKSILGRGHWDPAHPQYDPANPSLGPQQPLTEDEMDAGRAEADPEVASVSE